MVLMAKRDFLSPEHNISVIAAFIYSSHATSRLWAGNGACWLQHTSGVTLEATYLHAETRLFMACHSTGAGETELGLISSIWLPGDFKQAQVVFVRILFPILLGVWPS
jgi:hypothetical protein